MKNKIILTPVQITELNEICYRELVSSDGLNFKEPFMEGTTSYINGFGINSDIVIVDEKMEAIPAAENLISGTRYSSEELITMGKLEEDE